LLGNYLFKFILFQVFKKEQKRSIGWVFREINALLCFFWCITLTICIKSSKLELLYLKSILLSRFLKNKFMTCFRSCSKEKRSSKSEREREISIWRAWVFMGTDVNELIPKGGRKKNAKDFTKKKIYLLKMSVPNNASY